MSKKHLIVLTAIIFSGILFYPYQTEAVPELTLKVVNETGKPLSNVMVSHSWKDYLLEIPSDSEGEKKITDENGDVTFSSKKIRASLARRIFFKSWKTIFSFLPHIGFKVRALVFVPCTFESNLPGVETYYEPDHPFKETLIITSDCTPVTGEID